MKLKTIFAATAAIAVSAGLAVGAVNIPLFTGPQDVSNLFSYLNTLVLGINAGVTAQSVANSNTPRNILDNGAINVTQRPVAAATCGTASGIQITAYSADRWGCDVNAANAATLAVTTATPTPPTGFTNQLALVRPSGVVTQAHCIWQEIPTVKTKMLQGQVIMFSAYIAALAGLSADNGNLANMVIITGTGTDQGMGVLRSGVGMTAGPAITPAWTNIATLQTTALTLSTTYARYNGAAVAVPATVTEMAVGICFTPTAAGAGATDGLAATGIQLEVVTPSFLSSIPTVPSAFEFTDKAVDTAKAQRYFYAVAEPASGVSVPIWSTATAATTAVGSMAFPVTMDVAPTLQIFGTALSGSTWTNKCGAVNNALASTFFVVATANTTVGASYTVTSSGATAGFACVLTGAGGGNILSWSADF